MIDKSLLLIGWAMVVAVVFNTAPVTRLVYNPQTAQIVGEEIAVTRSFPMDAIGLPRPRLAYVENVRPLTSTHNGGHSCTDRGGPFRYIRADAVGVWSLGWASACTDDPTGFVWSAKWSWHIGALEAGPVILTQTFLAKAEGERQ